MTFNKAKYVLPIVLLFVSFNAPPVLAAQHSLGANIITPQGTVYTIASENGLTVRRPYSSSGVFLSYSFNAWDTVAVSSPEDMALPEGSLMPPQDGKVICSDRGTDKGTCYLITGGKKAGFTSASVFRDLGYSFNNVISGDVSFLPSTSNIYAAPVVILKDYQLYDRGPDVLLLQKFLNENNFLVAESGLGSPGNETSFLGILTYRALEKFQAAQNLPETGFSGPLTRAKIAEFSIAANTPDNTTPSPSNTIATSTPPSLTPPTPPPPAPPPASGSGGGGTQTLADTTAPTVSITAPGGGATVSGASVTLSATASDNIAVSGVTFKVDGTTIGVEDTTSPYSMTWDSTATSSGSKSITAVARDTSNNLTTSTAVSVTVDNTGPVISAISSGTPATTSVTITWTTDENADSQVNYGLTSSYGTTTTLDSTLITSHSVNITGLTSGTTYHFRVRSTDSPGNLSVSSDQTFTTPYSSEAQAFFDRLATQPDTTRKNLYATLIDDLVASGVWSNLDAFYVFAAADSATALTNLVQSSYAGTKAAAATFTADRGISGTAGVYGVDSNFNPTTAAGHYAQNSASVFAWSGNYLQQTSALFGAGTPATSFDKLELYTRYASNGFSYQEINVEDEKTDITSDGSGLFALDRASSTGWSMYQNGSLRSSQTSASSGTPNSTIKFVGANFSGNVAAAGFGQSLNASQHSALDTALRAYLTAVGAPVETASDILNVPGIQKNTTPFIVPIGHESTIGRAPNGDMIVIEFPFGPNPPIFNVYSYPSGTLLASKVWTNNSTDGGVYGTWMVVNGVIHMFGTKLDGVTVVHSTLDANYNPSVADTIYTSGVAIANLGIAADATGWVLSIEQLPSPQSVKVLRTTDPTLAAGWSQYGNIFQPSLEPENIYGDYVGSPKMIWQSGVYYLPYLVKHHGTFQTVIARSTDNWSTFEIYTGPFRVIYPSVYEDHNASDWTAVEGADGQLHAIYMDGNQVDVLTNRVATYPMTLQEFLAVFFP